MIDRAAETATAVAGGDPVLELDVELPLDRFVLEVSRRLRGPAIGVFGPSGAGKTSLLEVVAGLRRAGRGRVVCGGETWLDSARGIFVRPERRRLGYVPQDGLLFPHWNVRRNLRAGAGRLDGQAARRAFDDAVELLELGALLDRSPASLSGGERQRVALGRALCSGPRLLLLDEPMASLDLPLRRRLLPFLRRVRAELTVPMLLVSHDPLEVQALCDELLVLRRGRVLAGGEPRRVLTDPQVFPLAAERGFENVLAGRLADRRGAETGDVSRVALGADLGASVELVIPRVDAPPGEALLVSVPASDIVLATSRPEGLSARNVLAGRVAAVRLVSRTALVEVALGAEDGAGNGAPRLTAELAASTPSALGLEVGRRVHLLIKASSCRAYVADGGGSDRVPPR